jgi:hypothetical protein
MPASDYSVIDGDGYIDWRRLGAIVTGIVSVPVFTGAADVIRSIYRTFLINPLQRAGEVFGAAVSAPFATFEFAMFRAWETAGATVEASGIFGFALAVGIVVLVAYLVAQSGVLD